MFDLFEKETDFSKEKESVENSAKKLNLTRGRKTFDDEQFSVIGKTIANVFSHKLSLDNAKKILGYKICESSRPFGTVYELFDNDGQQQFVCMQLKNGTMIFHSEMTDALLDIQIEGLDRKLPWIQGTYAITEQAIVDKKGKIVVRNNAVMTAEHIDGVINPKEEAMTDQQYIEHIRKTSSVNFEFMSINLQNMPSNFLEWSNGLAGRDLKTHEKEVIKEMSATEQSLKTFDLVAVKERAEEKQLIEDYSIVKAIVSKAFHERGIL